MVKFKGNRYDKTVDLSIRKDDIIVCIAFMQSKVNLTGYATLCYAHSTSAANHRKKMFSMGKFTKRQTSNSVTCDELPLAADNLVNNQAL